MPASVEVLVVLSSSTAFAFIYSRTSIIRTRRGSFGLSKVRIVETGDERIKYVRGAAKLSTISLLEQIIEIYRI